MYCGLVVVCLFDFKGKWFVFGVEGSGVCELSFVLLKMNGIVLGGLIELLLIVGEDVVIVLFDGKIDVVFLFGDLMQILVMVKLFCVLGVYVYLFMQVEVYVWCFLYLIVIMLLMGVYDFGCNLLFVDIYMVVLMIEFVVCDLLYFVLFDLLIEVVCEVYGYVMILQYVGEFLLFVMCGFLLLDDVVCYYKLGKIFLYWWLLFWVVSFVDWLLVVVVLLIVVLILGLWFVLLLYGWCVCLCIYWWYGVLIVFECSVFGEYMVEECVQLFDEFDDIEEVVNWMKMLFVYVGQFYVLCEYIGFVCEWFIVYDYDVLVGLFGVGSVLQGCVDFVLLVGDVFWVIFGFV